MRRASSYFPGGKMSLKSGVVSLCLLCTTSFFLSTFVSPAIAAEPYLKVKRLSEVETTADLLGLFPEMFLRAQGKTESLITTGRDPATHSQCELILTEEPAAGILHVQIRSWSDDITLDVKVDDKIVVSQGGGQRQTEMMRDRAHRFALLEKPSDRIHVAVIDEGNKRLICTFLY